MMTYMGTMSLRVLGLLIMRRMVKIQMPTTLKHSMRTAGECDTTPILTPRKKLA
jgi:hypothetical protein